MKCPNCGLVNPETSERCDCGYSFGSVQTQAIRSETPDKVTVIDVKMPFGSMVIFMVKWAIATIPAAVILFLIYLALAAIFGSCMTGFGG